MLNKSPFQVKRKTNQAVGTVVLPRLAQRVNNLSASWSTTSNTQMKYSNSYKSYFQMTSGRKQLKKTVMSGQRWIPLLKECVRLIRCEPMTVTTAVAVTTVKAAFVHQGVLLLSENSHSDVGCCVSFKKALSVPKDQRYGSVVTNSHQPPSLMHLLNLTRLLGINRLLCSTRMFFAKGKPHVQFVSSTF